MRVERLRPDHAGAVLTFERENREYFARSVPDRGDAYFAEFDQRHRSLLAEQDAGLHHFHVIVDGGGAVIGRVNLIDIKDGVAELGYRVAERAAGRGLAKAAVAKVCQLAAATYGLTALTAVTTLDNPASRAVLEGNGFVAVREIRIDGRPGVRYERSLVSAEHGGHETGEAGGVVVE